MTSTFYLMFTLRQLIFPKIYLTADHGSKSEIRSSLLDQLPHQDMINFQYCIRPIHVPTNSLPRVQNPVPSNSKVSISISCFRQFNLSRGIHICKTLLQTYSLGPLYGNCHILLFPLFLHSCESSPKACLLLIV